jgi:glycosyltransferase involved in cell wall biosynthesis
MTDSRSSRPTLCIGILAMNEARRIGACVASASFADQVLVIDSGSTDATRDIAAAAGAEVHVYSQWEGFATQRNRLLAHVRTRYIFFLDADEVMPPALRDEILELIKSDQPIRGAILWNQVAYGRPLSAMKSTGGIERLFRTDTLIRFEGVVHEGAVLSDPSPPLVTFIRLYFFRRGFLCGAEGFLFCFFIALECFFRYAALKYDGAILSGTVKR